ncbi:MAG TPA: ATP-binding protein [Fimbriiglobus sp.]|nr:ATP-binding protein [Fimbriiglobus sp.]
MLSRSARSFLTGLAPRPSDSRWELAAEAIAVQIRWFGLVVGFLLVNFGSETSAHGVLNAILLLGVGFTAVDTAFFLRGRVFLRDFPLLISAMEALFIGLLCTYESGPGSPFRFYYLLSLICCAIRYPRRTTFVTCGLDCLSYSAVYLAEPAGARNPSLFLLTLVILVWVTWAAGAMARLLKRAGEELHELNAALRENQAQLETRITERTRELEESQAQVLHQEKMAAFGLLAAGIAHEVGNPLTSISSVVQMLERRDPDAYTREKLGLVTGQLARIQGTLRELVTFSRPASDQRGRVSVREVIDEALGIAKFYKGGKNRAIVATVADNLPPLVGVRDQFVQVVFNLVLNAIDATGKGGRISVSASAGVSEKTGSGSDTVTLTVSDDGGGIDPAHRARLFHPYFTTKKHGTGLGLFVIRRIVEAHGGTVAVESEPGKGAAFRVTLKSSGHQVIKSSSPDPDFGSPAVSQVAVPFRPDDLRT